MSKIEHVFKRMGVLERKKPVTKAVKTVAIVNWYGASCIGLSLQVAYVYFVDDDRLINLPFPLQIVQFKRLGEWQRDSG
jgi:hypothetical protein